MSVMTRRTFVNALASAATTAALAGCGAAGVEAAGPSAPDADSTDNRLEETMTINVTCNGRAVTYDLNDSAAARGLVEQLPLTLEVEPFGGNEQTFYPPEPLDCAGAQLAEGGAGVLAYYEPWGDVVMFYDDFSRNAQPLRAGARGGGRGARCGNDADHRGDAADKAVAKINGHRPPKMSRFQAQNALSGPFVTVNSTQPEERNGEEPC